MELPKYAIGLDACPNTDEVLAQWTCNNCKFYHGFSLEDGIPCIQCGFNDNCAKK